MCLETFRCSVEFLDLDILESDLTRFPGPRA